MNHRFSDQAGELHDSTQTRCGESLPTWRWSCIIRPDGSCNHLVEFVQRRRISGKSREVRRPMRAVPPGAGGGRGPSMAWRWPTKRRRNTACWTSKRVAHYFCANAAINGYMCRWSISGRRAALPGARGGSLRRVRTGTGGHVKPLEKSVREVGCPLRLQMILAEWDMAPAEPRPGRRPGGAVSMRLLLVEGVLRLW